MKATTTTTNRTRDAKNQGNERELAVLRHARTFPLAIPHGRKLAKMGGVVLSVGTVSDAEMAEIAGRLAERGFVSPHEASFHTIYEVTDMGRRAARGGAILTPEVARTLHARELLEVWGDTSVAREHLEHRERVRQRVLGVLAHLGISYQGTSGWHTLAFAVPRDGGHVVGFIDTARGLAVETDAPLSLAEVEALTVPEQQSGPQASGAVAWVGADVGEARRARSPDGWLQLLTDLRGSTDRVPCEARVVAWGLITCYGERGRPGFGRIDARDPEDAIDPRDWSIEREDRERMYEVGTSALDAIARVLGEVAGVGPELAECLDRTYDNRPVYAERGLFEPRLPCVDLEAAWGVAGRERENISCAYDARNALRSAVCVTTSRVVRDALRRAGVTRLALLAGDLDEDRVSGMRYYDVLCRLLERILRCDLGPTSEALWRALHVYETDPWQLSVGMLQPMLVELAERAADIVLGDITDKVPVAVHACHEALYARGHLAISIPVSARKQEAS